MTSSLRTLTKPVCVAIALGLIACAATRGLASAPEADQAEAKLREGGMIVSDPELAAYLASVASPLLGLAPASSPPLRIGVLRDPAVNAFALPNGAIYVNIGALARVDDEAQLALLLAQQMNHVALDHTAQIAVDRRAKTVYAKLTQVALAPLLGLTDIPFAWAMASYSREKEEEADRAGLHWVARAGFETRAAPRLLAVLGEADREALCNELVTSGAVAANANGRNDTAALRKAVARITLESLRLNLALREYESARDGARLAIARYGESAQLRAYEGEALLGIAALAPAEVPRELRSRGRNQRDREEADAQELARLVARAEEPLPDAEHSFRRALELDPGYGPARRGLGEVLLRRGDVDGGYAMLREYVAANPDAVDVLLVEDTLRRVRPAAPVTP